VEAAGIEPASSERSSQSRLSALALDPVPRRCEEPTLLLCRGVKLPTHLSVARRPVSQEDE